MKHYMIHVPGTVYAADEYAANKQQALRQYRSRWRLSRMPKGFAIWEV